MMILEQISYIDCVAFLIFLVPQLLLHINPFELFFCALKAVCFLVVRLPFQFTKERYFIPEIQKSPFVQQVRPFQDLVIRCVRYAFAEIPADIGRIFFSKAVALPFLRYRMIRHGFWKSPIPWVEVNLDVANGLWVNRHDDQEPDIVIYYCHGGGFAMGSSYFYLEFLLAWVSILKLAGYRNPAILALEYSLVPQAIYPTQLQQTIAGYEHVCSIVGDSSRICVAGDSAGATLVLSLLLSTAHHQPSSSPPKRHHLPGYATLISPWPTLISPKNQNTASDYLDVNTLGNYARRYASAANLVDPLVSPGSCKDLTWWANASPSAGFGICFGSEEVFAPEIQELVTTLRRSGCAVSVREEPGGIHAGPVVSLFLGDTQARRQRGLRDLTKMIRQAVPV